MIRFETSGINPVREDIRAESVKYIYAGSERCVSYLLYVEVKIDFSAPGFSEGPAVMAPVRLVQRLVST
jgi:hypothetical protein